MKTQEEGGVVSVLNHAISSPEELLATVCLVASSLTRVRRQFQFWALESTPRSTWGGGGQVGMAICVSQLLLEGARLEFGWCFVDAFLSIFKKCRRDIAYFAWPTIGL